MCNIGLQMLFTVASLTTRAKFGPEWLSFFEENILPTVSQSIKYITVYLYEQCDPVMARILRRLPNIRWLVLDLNLQTSALESIDVLSNFTNVTRLTTISSGPPLNCHMEVNTRLIRAYGKNLKSLDVYNSWNDDFSDLLHVIRDFCPILENIYIYGTAGTALASILIGEPAWPSRTTLKVAHFEACREIDAWIVASIAELYPALKEVRIYSCGGPGSYGTFSLLSCDF